MRKPSGLGLAAAIFLSTTLSQAAGIAVAQETAKGSTNIVIGGARPAPAEARDLAAYETAFDAYQRGSYAALATHLPRLREAMEHAPKTYAVLEQTGPGRWLVRADDMTAAIGLSAMAAAAAQAAEPGRQAIIETGPNVYPNIALLLGSEAVERHAYAEAIAHLDRGLELQPGNYSLAAEKMGAIQGQGRFAEALAVGDAALQAGGISGVFGAGSGIVHRRRGFSLVELGRLDEAQTAYERSLEVDPDSTVARGELEYIARLKAGAAATKAVPNAPPAATAPTSAASGAKL